MSDMSTKAYLRLQSLLDDSSFVEIGGQITARSTEFNMDSKKAPSDGVICGYGTIDNRLVYVYSQDSSVLGGSIGEMHAIKISNVYDMAIKMGAPVIGILDSNGIRLEESFDALDGLGKIYAKQVEASGIVPTITAVMGNAGGGLSFVAGLSDFVLATNDSKLFVNAPNALEGVNEDVCDTSSTSFQSECAGNIDFCGTEDEVIQNIQKLVLTIPSNNNTNISIDDTNDDLNRVCSNLNENSDAKSIASSISDNNFFLETKKEFGKEIITGFIKLNGETVGVVGNEDTLISTKGCRKAADFVKFCDAFRLPVLTLTSATGFKTTKCEEMRVSRSLTYLISTFANSDIPKVNLIFGKAYGSAYVAMNSKAIGADMVFAWNNATVGMMDSKNAAKIMYGDLDASTLNEKANDYENLQSNINNAASHGYVDTIINPVDSRKYVIGAFEMLYTKAEKFDAKKHLSI